MTSSTSMRVAHHPGLVWAEDSGRGLRGREQLLEGESSLRALGKAGSCGAHAIRLEGGTLSILFDCTLLAPPSALPLASDMRERMPRAKGEGYGEKCEVLPEVAHGDAIIHRARSPNSPSTRACPERGSGFWSFGSRRRAMNAHPPCASHTSTQTEYASPYAAQGD